MLAAPPEPVRSGFQGRENCLSNHLEQVVGADVERQLVSAGDAGLTQIRVTSENRYNRLFKPGVVGGPPQSNGDRAEFRRRLIEAFPDEGVHNHAI